MAALAIATSGEKVVLGSPDKLSLAVLNSEHADYTDWKADWERYHDAYVGGGEMLRNNRIALHLIKSEKEKTEVFQERASRAFDDNIFASVMDWYSSTEFRTEPQIKTAKSPELEDFLSNSDGNGATLTQFYQETFISAMVYRFTWILIDLPGAGPDGQVAYTADNRAVQRKAKLDVPYLCGYCPLDVPNWELDSRGNPVWIKIKQREQYYAGPYSKKSGIRETWTIYTATEFARYQREVSGEDADTRETDPNKIMVDRIAGGPHCMTDVGKVPVLRFELPYSLWFGNKIYSLFKEYLNKTNALAWGIHRGCVAMPIIYSNDKVNVAIGETEYLQLGAQDKFGWTEPAGTVYATALAWIDSLVQAIYRGAFLQQQAVTTSTAKNLQQSGTSKQRDFATTVEILRSFGSRVRDGFRNVLKMASEVVDVDPDAVEVTGFDSFDIASLAEDMDMALESQALGIPSDTFDRETKKRIALKMHDNAEPAIKAKIAKEIDDAPPASLTGPPTLAAGKNGAPAGTGDTFGISIKTRINPSAEASSSIV